MSSTKETAETLKLLRVYSVKDIAYKEKGYCGTCEGYETIVAQMADENGDEWEVCADCLKDFREQAARFASQSSTDLKRIAESVAAEKSRMLAVDYQTMSNDEIQQNEGSIATLNWFLALITATGGKE